jgi:hypothetical protein
MANRNKIYLFIENASKMTFHEKKKKFRVKIILVL